MALIKMECLKEFMDIPAAAEILLGKSEKEIKFAVNLRTSDEEIISYDAFIIYHNSVLGPPKGGVRFSPSVSIEETRNLAEIMTYKNALMELPFGGGKSGIRFDPYKIDDFTRIAVVKEYVHMIREELYSRSYIPAPDMGSTPEDMGIIYGETHIPETVTGKPVIIGGLPGRLQATGRGVYFSAKLGIERLLKKKMHDTAISIQGFGNVGRWTSFFLYRAGAKIVAVSDAGGAVCNEKGLDIEELFKYAPRSKDTVRGFPGGSNMDSGDFMGVECDVFIPAAVENVITEETAPKINARLIVEGANNPSDHGGTNILLGKGAFILPDFFANSGGVIASYIEWRNAKSGNQTSQEEVFDYIDEKIEYVFNKGMKTMKDVNCPLIESFSVIAAKVLIKGMKARLWI